MPLKLAVEKAAWNAAFRDPRFDPVPKDELGELPHAKALRLPASLTMLNFT
jgi:AMMECR1 domain-containing protein